jgi:xanthine dehydrogenase molybdenum-binding subunit
MTENKLLVEGTPPPPLDREFTVIGKSLNRRDGVEKVKGEAKYSGDIKLPNMFYGMISPPSRQDCYN